MSIQNGSQRKNLPDAATQTGTGDDHCRTIGAVTVLGTSPGQVTL